MVGRRLLVPLAFVLVAIPACAILVTIVVRAGSDSDRPETRRESTVRALVTASFRPEVHRFGEPVTATIALTARKAEIDLATARPTSDLDPYAIVGRARRELHEFGALAQLRYTLTVQCLRQACLPQPQTREFLLGNARVDFKTPPPPGRLFKDRRLDQRAANGAWPTLKVTSWLTPADLQAARWRSNLADLPEPSYAVSPRWLVGGLLGGAVALVLVAAALLSGFVRDLRGRRRADHRVEVEAAPLEQALALVEDSRTNGDVPGRRVALETLARELRHGGESDLAADAERLAWSPDAPADGAVDTLVATVRESVNGGPG